jgi:chromosomal replication initiation ATPase DnaA
MDGLIAYAGEDIAEKPFHRRTALEMGYTKEFVEKARQQTRERTARTELNRLGLMKFRNYGMPEWARMIVAEVCELRNVFVDDVAGMSRRHKVVRARNEAIYRIKASKPMLSSPQMGRWFNRNHVSILYALASYSDAKGLPNLTYYDIDNSRTRKREAAAAKVAMRRMLKAA